MFRLTNECTITLYCAGSRFTFPVTPASYDVENSYNNSTLNVITLGEVNMRGKRNLMSVSFDSFFPSPNYVHDRHNFLTPNECVQKIKSFAESSEPCKLVIGGTNVAFYCTVESFKHSESDGSGDVYFSIQLKEYRYIRPDSKKPNSVTGLRSRIAETLSKKEMVINAAVDLMDTANIVTGQFENIKSGGTRGFDAYAEIIKSGAELGDVVEATSNQVRVIRGGQHD